MNSLVDNNDIINVNDIINLESEDISNSCSNISNNDIDHNDQGDIISNQDS